MSAAVASAGPLLEVDDLAKHFTLHVLDGRRLPAFAGVSFTLARGECLLLRGRSGTGKSSLLKCLYRTYRATGGRAVILAPQGRADLVTVPDVEVLGLRRTVIGYVSQFFWAIPRVAAASVVAEPLLDLGVEPERARRAAREMLERFDVPRTLWECFPSTFSGGERQCVNLARALIVPRDLLLLDEPTASLDAARAGLVTEVLEERKAQGTAMVAVFHDAVASGLPDRVYEMADGRAA